MDWPRGRVSLALVAILGIALGLRIVAAVAVQQRLQPGEICLIAGDATGYWDLGRQLAAGDDYAIYDPPRYVLRMPGFPGLLALCQLIFGPNLLATRFVLALIGTAACGLVYWLGYELFDPLTGLLAAALTAVWPTMILFSVLILSETLFAATMTASLIAAARVFRSGNVVTAIFTGCLVGLTTLVRPTWLLAGPFIAVALIAASRTKRAPSPPRSAGDSASDSSAGERVGGRGESSPLTPALSPTAERSVGNHPARGGERARFSNLRRSLLTAVAVLIGLAFTLAPWTLRNAIVTGHFVPTTLWVGPSLYDGLSPQADGSSRMEFVERDGVYLRMSEYDADQFYRQEAWKFATENPGRAVVLGFLKLGRYLSPWPNAAQFQHPLSIAALSTLFAVMIGLAGVGLWESRHDARAGLIPLAPFIYFALIHTVFVGSLRYRLPAEYPLMVLVAAGAIVVLRKRRQETGDGRQGTDPHNPVSRLPSSVFSTGPSPLPPRP